MRQREGAMDLRVGDTSGEVLLALIEQGLRTNNLDVISDQQFKALFAAVVKLYVAKAERFTEQEYTPVDHNALTATQSIVAACALIRAADLNLFDVAMWFGRGQATSKTV